MSVGATFADVNKIDTAPAWRFMVVLPNIQGFQQIIDPIRAASVTLPIPFVDMQSVFQGSFHRWYPESYAVDNLDVTLLEFPDWSILQYLMAWRALQVDSNGLWGLPSDYKQDIFVYPLNHQGGVALGLQYIGCQPSRPQQVTLDGKTSDVVHQVISFTCDNMKLVDASGGNNQGAQITSPTVAQQQQTGGLATGTPTSIPAQTTLNDPNNLIGGAFSSPQPVFNGIDNT